MKKLKITLGILFVFQMFAFGAFAKEKSENLADKKVINNESNCCLYWGDTKKFAVQICGYGSLNCEYAKIFHDMITQGKIFVLSRRRR